jgi:EmrB/QacA subfamily drug resistance transporter
VHSSDRYRWYALWCALAGLFASGCTITIISVSLGRIARDLHTNPGALTWTVTGPMLAVAISMPLAGKLGDLRGHRRVYLVGFAIFTVFSGLAALAWNPESLTVLRVLGAFGGAATAPASMAIVMHHFTGDDRVRAMGWWQLVGAGGPVIGLAVGGPVVDAFGWRWIFVGQFVFAVVALIATSIVLRDTGHRSGASLDVAGAATLGIGAVALLLALQRGGATGWMQPAVPALVAVGAAMLIRFVRIERTAAEPILPLEFFGRRNFTASILTQFAANFAYMGSFIISPLLVTNRFGFTTGAAAAAMAIRPLTFSLTSPISGYVAVRQGERRMSVVGISCVVLAMGAFAVAAFSDTLALVYVGLGVAGLGMGIATPSLVTSVGNTVDTAHLGSANAAQAMVAALGSATGIQVLSTVQEAGTGRAGFGAAYLVAATFAAAAVFSASFVQSQQSVRGLRLATAA